MIAGLEPNGSLEVKKKKKKNNEQNILHDLQKHNIKPSASYSYILLFHNTFLHSTCYIFLFTVNMSCPLRRISVLTNFIGSLDSANTAIWVLASPSFSHPFSSSFCIQEDQQRFQMGRCFMHRVTWRDGVVVLSSVKCLYAFLLPAATAG